MFNEQDLRDMQKLIDKSKHMEKQTSVLGWKVLLTQMVQVLSQVSFHVINDQKPKKQRRRNKKKKKVEQVTAN